MGLFNKLFGKSSSPEWRPSIRDLLYGDLPLVEFGMPKGLDLIAAYPDHWARYYNFSGAAVIWEHPDDSLDATIDSLLVEASKVVVRMGPWDKERPGPPPKDQMRLSFLTPSGIHFGQAPINTLAADPMAAPVVRLAADLMHALMAKPKRTANGH